MKFHCLLPVRDEADIIEQCLNQLLTWADAIYIFDTGSGDGTWEIIQEAARNDRRIIPLRQDPVYYSEGMLRGWLFNEARKRMKDGDWFLRVDADEFHHIAPPRFVKEHLKPHETVVYHQYYEFVVRDSDVRAWENGCEGIADRQRPIEQRRQWYYTYPYSEPRLCRYREGMKWPATVSFPYNAGLIAQKRLPIRHYPHRDPDQMQKRSLLRSIIQKNRTNIETGSGSHWYDSDWKRNVFRDDNDTLKLWKPGDPLPDPGYTTHLSTGYRLFLQRILHKCLLPVVDRTRVGWDARCYPEKIQAEIQRQLIGIHSRD